MDATAEITAIVTVSPGGVTVAHLQRFVAAVDRFGLGDDTRLIDGPPAGPAPGAGLPDTPEVRTVGDIRSWARSLVDAGAEPTLEIGGLADLCVDLDVVAVELAGCAEHIGFEPALVVVQTDSRCAAHEPTTAAGSPSGAGTIG